jgi:5,10-methylenetetrahydromethanopterin reductase
VTALREAMECVRHLLARSPAPYAGAVFRLAGGDSLRWAVSRPDVPFLLGTWGARTIRDCIQHVAEVKVGGTANPDSAPHFRALIANAATSAGRNLSEVALVFGAVTVVDRDGAAARQRARREAALYLPVVARLDPTIAVDPALLHRIEDAAAAYDFERAAACIPDDLLRRFAFAGTPDEVAEQAAALFAAGVSRVEFGTPHGLTEDEGLRLLGRDVLPALRDHATS